MTEEEWKAQCAALTDEDEPADEELDPEPEEYDLEEVIAECRQISEDQARAAANAARPGTARLGRGLPRRVPEPGGAVRQRDADGHHARLPGTSGLRRRRRRGR